MKRKRKRRFRGPEFTRDYTEEPYAVMRKLLTAFPGKFVDINPDHVEIIFRMSPKSNWYAKTQLVKGLRTLDTNKKITILIHKQSWDLRDDYQKFLLLYEQLLKIYFDDKKKEYRLKKYDVQTFGEMLKDFGLKYEKAKDKFSNLIEKEEAYVDQTA